MEDKNKNIENKETWEKPQLNNVGVNSETQAGGDVTTDGLESYS